MFNACSLSINTVSPSTACQRRLVIPIWVERGGDTTKLWLSRRASLVRRVGVAVISFLVWYLDSVPPRKIRVRTAVLRSTYRMYIVIALYVTAVVQRTSIYRTLICTYQYVQTGRFYRNR